MLYSEQSGSESCVINICLLNTSIDKTRLLPLRRTLSVVYYRVCCGASSFVDLSPYDHINIPEIYLSLCNFVSTETDALPLGDHVTVSKWH